MESVVNDKAEPRGIHRRIQFDVTPGLVSRFVRNVDRKDSSECWLWTGAVRNGYGAIKHDNKVLGTHVVAFRMAGGVIGAGELVVHSCDNKLCCNPSHLSAGTATRNVREMYERLKVNYPRGEEVWRAVLNQETVQKIRALRLRRRIGADRIMRLIGCNSRSAVDSVCRGRTWNHVPELADSEYEAIASAIVGCLV